MSEEVRSRIFEPFFTTKEATGTGLGLWVSAEVISKHHGDIRIRSRAAAEDGSRPVATGTVFMIFFPAERAEQTQVERAQTSFQVS
jgi:signal transduction histidine kinase